MNIGMNIRAIREEQKISQEELAAKAGYKNSAIIVAIENGNSEPAYDKIKDLANALGVSIYQVKGQNKFRKVSGEGIYYNEAELKALDLFAPLIAEMDGEEVGKVVEYATMLLHAKNKKAHWQKPKYAESAKESDAKEF